MNLISDPPHDKPMWWRSSVRRKFAIATHSFSKKIGDIVTRSCGLKCCDLRLRKLQHSDQVAAENKAGHRKAGQQPKFANPIVKKEKLTLELFDALENFPAQCGMTTYKSDEDWQTTRDAGKLNFAEPFAVEAVDWFGKFMQEGESLKRKITYFQSSYGQAVTVQHSGRGQFSLHDELGVREHLLGYVSADARYNPSAEDRQCGNLVYSILGVFCRTFVWGPFEKEPFRYSPLVGSFQQNGLVLVKFSITITQFDIANRICPQTSQTQR